MTDSTEVSNEIVQANEFEGFENEIKKMEGYQEKMSDLFDVTNENLKLMLEGTKRKGGGVSLAFIHNQTANLATIMSSNIAISKAIIDAKQKSFANNLKVNPIVETTDSDSIPAEVVKQILEMIPTFSGAPQFDTVDGEFTESDVDDEIEKMLADDSETIEATPEEEAEEIVEDDLGDDMSDLEVICTENGQIHLIDAQFRVFDNLVEDLPEEKLDIQFDESNGSMYAEFNGEKLRIVDESFLLYSND